MNKIKLCFGVIIGILVILVIGGGIFVMRNRTEQTEQDPNWIELQQQGISNILTENVQSLVKKDVSEQVLDGQYEAYYDFNEDGVEEVILIKFEDVSGVTIAGIQVDGVEPVEFEMTSLGDSTVFSVVAIELKGEKRLAAVESVIRHDGDMGCVKCVVWELEDSRFEETSNIYYSGMIGRKGLMVEGIISNNVSDDNFQYDVEEDQNEYIYERSRIFADMREIGIKFPYGTVGNHIVTYKKNVTGLFNIIVS